MNIRVTINGETKNFENTLTIAQLLDSLSIQKEKVVVEKNLQILSRADFSNSLVADGDQLEIVHFVGGGAPSGKSLVIVESPAKCKTIHKYLGPNFEVAASMGHVIDLPKSKMGIDIENNFEPQYIVVKDRKKTLSELKKKAKDKKTIYLACDPDREGEAISWHLKDALGKGKEVYRVVFNEITKEAVQKAFKTPHDIDMNLVGAQQARRVLDRLVGYNLSPLLWQKVGRGLSAGRVQSVALRLIVDQERKIRAFVPQEYWTLEAQLQKREQDTRVFTAILDRIEDKKTELENKSQTDSILNEIENLPFEVQDVKNQKKKRNPSAPFTTSKLQQSAYNRYRFPASKTMRTAQTLYEGVEIGDEGSVGLITYMRTDSVRISESAITEIRDYVQKTYGNEYLPEKPNVYKAKKAAQEAHEAIRPTAIAREPKALEPYLSLDQMKLYTLIWEQAVSSQMMPAQISQDTAEIRCGRYIFKSSGSRVEFPGFLIVLGREDEKDNPLPELKIQEKLNKVKVEGLQHFTKPPARFTDASLVKALEERGIGRPSTYAPIIATLTGRDYIRRDGGSLVPTELGILVTDLLVKHFSKVMDFDFTAGMEEELDKIEEGDAQWVRVVEDFYNVFKGQMALAKDQIETVKKVHEPTDEVCEICGKPMVIKWGRRGRFMSCSGWPECKNAKSISTDVVCPQCKTGKLVQRKAKSGKGRLFFGCTTYPSCNFITNRLPSKNASETEAPPPSPEKTGEDDFDIA